MEDKPDLTCPGCGNGYWPKQAWIHDGSACRPPCLLPDGSHAVPHWAVKPGVQYRRWTENLSTKVVGVDARKAALVEAVAAIKPFVATAVSKPVVATQPAMVATSDIVVATRHGKHADPDAKRAKDRERAAKKRAAAKAKP